jgi:hypothetical protein
VTGGGKSQRNTIAVGGHEYKIVAPGLKVIRRKFVSNVYWAAAEAEEFLSYRPRTVPIHVDLAVTDPDAVAALIATVEGICQREQQAMLAWADGAVTDKQRLRAKFDGTLGSVIELYRSDEESGFTQIKANSKDNYEEWLAIVDRTIGARRLDCLSPKYFRGCHSRWAAPEVEGSPRRLRRAYGCIQMVKVVLNYGIEADLPHCRRLREGMEHIRFPRNPPRDETMSYSHASAFVDTCLQSGNVSMGLCQAIQWDCMLRQKDVIGEWRVAGADYALSPGEIRQGGRVWSGLTLDLIMPGKTLTVRTSKTSQPVVHLLDECELIMRCMPHIDRSIVNAPVAVSSQGMPWSDHRAFGKAWARIAKLAGIPKGVWNMDSRASGVTEAAAGGASDDDLASNAGHRGKGITRRVYKRGAPEISKRVQRTRHSARLTER